MLQSSFYIIRVILFALLAYGIVFSEHNKKKILYSFAVSCVLSTIFSNYVKSTFYTCVFILIFAFIIYLLFVIYEISVIFLRGKDEQ